MVLFAVALMAAGFAGWAQAGEDEGRPACDYCRMIIQDWSFGGDLRSPDREHLIFDATECMAAYWLTQHRDTTRLRSLRSIPHDRPGERIDARRAWYVHSDSLASPMGVRLSAYGSAAAARLAARRYHGRVLTWNQTVDLVRRTWFPVKVP